MPANGFLRFVGVIYKARLLRALKTKIFCFPYLVTTFVIYGYKDNKYIWHPLLIV